MNSPILFLIFKRPDVTARAFEAIRQVQPSRLYIASDGARPEREGEAEKVAQTRSIVLQSIDWPCEVKTLLRETNFGCGIGVSSAIDWFFEQEEAGIILEDDCLPDQSFFRFCEELLDYYRHDMRVMTISGDNFQQGQRRGEYSYYFSQLPHCWGWATWRRAWRMYQVAIEYFEEIMAEPVYQEFTHYPLANTRFQKVFQKAFQQEMDNIWDRLWTFTNFINHGLVILPQHNLVQNIGFGSEATHTTRKEQNMSIPAQTIEFPLQHPPYMCLHKEADMFYYETILKLTQRVKPSAFSRVRKKIRPFFHKIGG